MTSVRRSLSRSLRRSRRRRSIRNERANGGACQTLVRALRFSSPSKPGNLQNSRLPKTNLNEKDVESPRAQNVTKGNLSLHVNKAVTSLFDSGFEGATLMRVPVEQCVSIEELRGRPLTECGVKRFEYILNGGAIGTVTGHIAVGRKPIITPLPEADEESIRNYFLERGREEAAVEEWVRNRKIYHVVDGAHEHAAQWKHGEKNGYEFSDRGWWTICIEWQPPNVLKAMSRMANTLQKKQFVVDYTTADQVLSFREVMEEVASERNIVIGPGKSLPSGFVSKSVRAFAGGASYSNQTLSNLGPTVARMTLRLARSMKRIIDEEVPDVSDELAAKKKSNRFGEDSRVFRKLLNTQNIRCAKKFLSPQVSDEDRENVLFRLRYVARESGNYKGLSHQHWNDQTAKAVAARKEVEKFRSMLGGDRYPESVGNRIRSMLTTTEYDEDIANGDVDESGLMRVLTDAFIKDGGQRAATRFEQYVRKKRLDAKAADEQAGGTNGMKQLSGPNSSKVSEVSSENDLPHISNAAEDELIQEPRGTETIVPDAGRDIEDNVDQNSHTEVETDGPSVALHQQNSDEAETSNLDDENTESDNQNQDNQDKPTADADVLEQCNVEVYRETWLDYMRSRMSEEGLFDFVILEPYQRGAQCECKYFDEEEIGKLGTFVRKALAQNGFCFAILPWECLGQWKRIFQTRDLDFYSIFRLGFEGDSLQRIKGKAIRDPFEDALVFRRHTKKKASVKVNYPYSLVNNCSYSRRFAIIDKIPLGSRLTFRGSKMQVRTTEKTPALYWELMRTFCPPSGKVLDIFSGAMASGIACIKSYRSCVLLEEDQRCFDLAVDRLKGFAKERLEKCEILDLDELQDAGDSVQCKEREDAIDQTAADPNESQCESIVLGEDIKQPTTKASLHHGLLSEDVSDVPEGTMKNIPNGSDQQHGLSLLANSAATLSSDQVPSRSSGIVEKPKTRNECGVDREGKNGNSEPNSPGRQPKKSIEQTKSGARRKNRPQQEARKPVLSKDVSDELERRNDGTILAPSPSKALPVADCHSPDNRQKLRKVLTASIARDLTPAESPPAQPSVSRYPTRVRIPTKKATAG